MMKHGGMCPVHMVAWWLLFIGGVNWGLVGAFKLDLVQKIFGAWPAVASVIYILVGLSAIAMLFKHSCKKCKQCDDKCEMPKK